MATNLIRFEYRVECNEAFVLGTRITPLVVIAPARDQGTVRRRDNTLAVVFKPAETISELSTFANIALGDVL